MPSSSGRAGATTGAGELAVTGRSRVDKAVTGRSEVADATARLSGRDTGGVGVATDFHKDG